MTTILTAIGARREAMRHDEGSAALQRWIALTRQSRIEVPRLDYEKLSNDRMEESSEAIRARVQVARDIQYARFTASNSQSTDIICNADICVGETGQFCKLQEGGQSLM